MNEENFKIGDSSVRIISGIRILLIGLEYYSDIRIFDYTALPVRTIICVRMDMISHKYRLRKQSQHTTAMLIFPLSLQAISTARNYRLEWRGKKKLRNFL